MRSRLEALIGLGLMGMVLITNPWEEVQQSAVEPAARIAAPSTGGAAIRGVAWDFQLRWFGTPALWQPPPIDNTDITFYEVRGTTQRELLASIAAADICKTHGR